MGVMLNMPWVLGAIDLSTVLEISWAVIQIFLGFSAIIFVHELGHFMAARWAGIRVEKFCIGFGKEVVGFTRGETRYALNALPLGGYVKMMGQDDFDIDKSGEIIVKNDPRSFSNKPVLHRMIVVSGGVIMNVIFAALLFMIVFMIGKDMETNEIGLVVPGTPADRGGLQPGDIIRKIDGDNINDFGEVRAAITLAEPHKVLDFVVEREGRLVSVPVLPENDKDRNVLTVGIAPAVTAKIIYTDPTAVMPGVRGPQPGDVIVEVDGLAVTEDNINQVFWSVLNRPDHHRSVVVEREEKPGDPSTRQRTEISVQPRMSLSQENPADPNSMSLLGLRPMTSVVAIDEESRAYKEGLKGQDIILEFGSVHFPTPREIQDVVKSNQDIDIPVRVRRIDGTEAKFTLRPEGRSGGPGIRAAWELAMDSWLGIGRSVEKIDGRPSPAAVSGIPAGAVIRRVNETAVGSWQELIDAFQSQAGQTVKLAYEWDGQEAAVDFAVPHCLRTKLGLTSNARILEINGQSHIEIEHNNRRVPADVNNPLALREALRRQTGKSVQVTYREGRISEPKTARVDVTDDMIDPWLGRIEYMLTFGTSTRTFPVQTSNPLKAMRIGVTKTIYFLRQVYLSIQRMVFSRSVGVENISGPVGIMKLGTEAARQGLPELLFLLALLSANLAVINFLPLPIMDGGLMVFLIIEGIKGSPVGIKTQVVTQIIGLALIFVAFVFVTFQDVLRWAPGAM